MEQDRLSTLLECFRVRYHTEPTHIVSSPGRVELGGNHTDHNGGKVLSAAVDLDMLALVAPLADEKIIVYAEARGEQIIDITDLTYVPDERGHSPSLIRGVLYFLKEKGYKTGGMLVVMHSDVLPGSGLSSSAAFENLIVASQSALYNNSMIEATEIAKISQLAENDFFGKPCGLMDQLTSVVGGVLMIDFAKDDPEIASIPFDLEAHGYRLIVVNTKSSHADLTPTYAKITEEMRFIADALGGDILGEVDPDRFYAEIARLRMLGNDRAVLRAHHFFAENERVPKMLQALSDDQLARYFSLVRESGMSSSLILQNTRIDSEPMNQPITLALAMSDHFLAGDGAARIQGGGFAGTIQAYVPLEKTAEYIDFMNGIFGENSCAAVRFRKEGVTTAPFSL
ncbi:MAG TPA: galactokinase [Fastidiosipila sp.]|nr:galactokinase [Fastidiosipila sp.]